jgi:hypothetical protein
VQFPPDSAGEETFTLKDVPINGKGGFKSEDPITVVTRATDAWITTLFSDKNNPQTYNSNPDLYHSAWLTPGQPQTW